MKHTDILLLVLLFLSFGGWNVSDAERAENDQAGKRLLKRKLFTTRLWQGLGAQRLIPIKTSTALMQLNQHAAKGKSKKKKRGKPRAKSTRES